ncbi:piriformospora indica-insensitive protein 2-like isoform X2 [Actinidia eriantha]|nr:piriformospora indica-insensitive protein 2-like isoform X2 [Actinidia eriantha]XP_057486147.1 piriformospora indica-insensitive protein 2-like isoform X2 [Actinidia eriantha]XP_057486148.1 piriformospora indica-insensitive protein 2-like isoform X2 [Actinidia eriantha]XP_057486149.1 piriformospora indica-insensitive protein 2-like isoform X2 [Actinidia eriantha]XP_057486150.1 piriformospora indica-insensitive protein 2-like isoform X2 [Actinidia eriantha]XP_057486152.1 piriformospora indic
MEKTEREALYSTIQGFVGYWWNGSELYPDPCGWTPIQGVSCDLFEGSWYVTDLNIGPFYDNSLVCAPNVQFRPDFFALKYLKSLSIFNCFTSPHHFPISIPTKNWESLYGSLQSLEFRSNPGLIGQIPTSFGYLKNLQSLVLLENGLTGELPSNIGNLVRLRRLVLAGNRFWGQVPDSFGGLRELLILDLSQNSLSGPLPVTFGGLTSLLKLDLSSNQLEGKIPIEFGKLKNLTLLDLSKNKFSGGLVQSLQELCSLEELVLSNNPIGGDLFGVGWHNLKSLVILDLSNLGLTSGIPETFIELKRLRFLGLGDNKLTGNLSPKLEALPSISAIYLNGNNLTGDLKFSEGFYGKLGRRFGAWNNPNLCYPNGLVSPSNRPFGVRPCQREVTLYGLDHDGKSKVGNGNLNQNSQFLASLGFSRYGLDGFWKAFMVETLMIVLGLNVLI